MPMFVRRRSTTITTINMAVKMICNFAALALTLFISMETLASPVRHQRSTIDHCGLYMSPSDTDIDLPLDQELKVAKGVAIDLARVCQETKDEYGNTGLLDSGDLEFLESNPVKLPGLPHKSKALSANANVISNILRQSALNVTLIHKYLTILQTYQSPGGILNVIDPFLEKVKRTISTFLCTLESSSAVVYINMTELEREIEDELLQEDFGLFDEKMSELENEDWSQLTTKTVSYEGYRAMRAIQQIVDGFKEDIGSEPTDI